MTTIEEPQVDEVDNRVDILFVCKGNICRSTMAEAVFQNISKYPDNPLIGFIDSAGTIAYHTGTGPDSRTMSTLSKNGVNDYVHAARQVRDDDFRDFDYILGMDSENVSNLKFIRSRIAHKKGIEENELAQVRLFGEYGGNVPKPNKGKAVVTGEEIEDPYYGGQSGFDTAYEQCVRFSKALLAEIEKDFKSGEEKA